MGADFLKALQQGLSEHGPLRKGHGLHPFFMRLRTLYAKMDEAYSAVADYYGFTCRGCDDNCCTQIFHHHTLAEYLGLFEGLQAASHGGEILARAVEVQKAYDEGKALICPVNQGGLCSLYAARPMICRLHGLPHEFLRPDGTVSGGACRRFEIIHSKGHETTRRLDRTPFYAELAMIEKDLRPVLGFTGRVRMTTAGMLLHMAAGGQGPFSAEGHGLHSN